MIHEPVADTPSCEGSDDFSFEIVSVFRNCRDVPLARDRLFVSDVVVANEKKNGHHNLQQEREGVA